MIVEAALGLLGAALLALAGGNWAASLLAQKDGNNLLHSLPRQSGVKTGIQPSPPGSVEAELLIPSIGLRTPVLTGCTDNTLRRGACRLLGTAVAGGLGNMAIAGHRDTSFRPLQNLRKGEVVTIADRTGRYEYVVDTIDIVTPDDVEVLDIHDRPELTLITCFPFHYIGAAPRRYVVHAHLRFVKA